MVSVWCPNKMLLPDLVGKMSGRAGPTTVPLSGGAPVEEGMTGQPDGSLSVTAGVCLEALSCHSRLLITPWMNFQKAHPCSQN